MRSERPHFFYKLSAFHWNRQTNDAIAFLTANNFSEQTDLKVIFSAIASC